MSKFTEYLEASYNSSNILKPEELNIWLSDGVFIFGKMSDTTFGSFEKIKASQILLFHNTIKGDYLLVFDSKKINKNVNKIFKLHDSSKSKSLGNFKLIEKLSMTKESLDSIKNKYKITSSKSGMI